MHKDTGSALPDSLDFSASSSPQEKANDSPPAPFPVSDTRPYAGPASQPDAFTTDSRPDPASTTSFPLSQPPDFFPIAGSLSRDSALYSSSGDVAKRRPLPTPPSLHPPSSSHQPHLSPPPPYSRSLPADDPVPMSHDLPTVASLPPEAPVIMTPPDEQVAHSRAPYDSFLCHSPPANTWIAVETSPSEYVLLVRLPGFRRDGITIATKRRRILHVVADSWEPEGGHFERRVSFGYDAELTQVRAEFDGEMLRIIVPRRAVAVATA